MDDPNVRGAEPAAHPKRPGALRARVNVRTAFERFIIKWNNDKKFYDTQKLFCVYSSISESDQRILHLCMFFIVMYIVYIFIV